MSPAFSKAPGVWGSCLDYFYCSCIAYHRLTTLVALPQGKQAAKPLHAPDSSAVPAQAVPPLKLSTCGHGSCFLCCLVQLWGARGTRQLSSGKWSSAGAWGITQSCRNKHISPGTSRKQMLTWSIIDEAEGQYANCNRLQAASCMWWKTEKERELWCMKQA